MPSVIKSNMDRAKAHSFGMSDIDLDVVIKLVNDTNKDITFNILSAYLDGTPYLYNEVQAKRMHSYTITLSNVSVDNALANQYSSVLLKK